MSSGPRPGVGHGPLGRLDDDPDRPAEDLLAVHEQRPAVLALEEVPQRPVGVQVPADEVARAVDGLDHDGAGAVADDDGDLAVVHVGDARERLGADQQDGARADGDEAGRGHEAIDEPGAGGVEVEGAALHADPVLHAGRRAGDDAVRRGGGEHEVVDLFGGPAGLGQRGDCGLNGQARGGAADVALPDAGPLDDPGVAGIEVDRHVVVGDDLVGYRDAPACDLDARHAADPERTAWMPTNPASP